MEYITNINWRRRNSRYYIVTVEYERQNSTRGRIFYNYPASKIIKQHSRLGRLLRLKHDTRLSLYYVRLILEKNYYELFK